MTPTMASALCREADRHYCDTFAGSEGGAEATRLAMYPFLQEIVKRLRAAAALDDEPSVSLFSGHDTVIAPVLSALGVYKRQGLCEWPPYASRIIFELYRRASNHFVRVVYNGQPMVGVLGCRGSAADLCPL